MNINFENLEQPNRYKLMSNLIIPRPIAWISTLSKENILNIAPFSYFAPLSSNPPAIIVSIGHKKDGSPKDTLKNLRDTKKCSLVIASVDEIKHLHKSKESLEHNKSEFDEFEIESKIINNDYPAVPKSSKVVFFCDLLQEVDLKNSKTIPVILEIKKLFIDDSLIDKDTLKVEFKDAIARVGAKYFTLGEEIEVD